jgi:uncharacterized protein (TIGR02996 family)
MTDEGFLRVLRANPQDDTTRLVYADWLEEQGDPIALQMAEFLRLSVQQPAGVLRTRTGRKRLRKRLQHLAAQLDTDWLAVVSRLDIELCRLAPVSPSSVCDRHWEDLRPTEKRTVRFCDACQQHVHYCDTIIEARQHAAQHHCVAVDLGVIRRDGDLTGPRLLLGRIRVEDLQAERERLRLDPVSEERERRKGRVK